MFEEQTGNTRELNEAMTRQINQTFLKDLEHLKKNVNNHSIQEILQYFCRNEGDHLIINMGLIKFINHLQPPFLINYVEEHVKQILERNQKTREQAIIHVSLKNLSITQIDSNMGFIQQFSNYFCEKYPNLLNRCYLHHSSNLFTYVFKLMNAIFLKETMARMECYK
jgi:hypothetical protein